MNSDVSQLKHVVVDELLSEAEVHPPQTYERTRATARESARELLAARSSFCVVDCPGCGAATHQPAFELDGFAYRRCASCWTLYVSPRPNADQQRWYLRDSPYAAYRCSEEYLDAMKSKVLDLARARADWLDGVLPGDASVLVAYAGSAELLELLARRRRVLVAEPLVDCVGIDGVESVDIDDTDHVPCDALLLLDALEPISDVPAVIGQLIAHLAPKAILALTTRSSSGLDVQVLQERCPTIFPPTHLNLLSVEGCHALAQRHGFRTLELSTPGLLDVEVLRRSLGSVGDTEESRFFRYFLENRGPDARARLQRFLQQTQTSSHVRLLATRT